MTQQEIREARTTIRDQLRPARQLVRALESQLKQIQWKCRHPESTEFSGRDDGDRTISTCPDCDWTNA